MHYGGAVGDQSTASMIFSLSGGAPTVFLSGTSPSLRFALKTLPLRQPPRACPFQNLGESGRSVLEKRRTYAEVSSAKSFPPNSMPSATRWSELDGGRLPDGNSMDELLLRALREEAAFYAKFDPQSFPAHR
jgi:hypothetical protein